ncbi:toxin-antitoxin system YwqK family antitoxin [Leptospira levettii]|uniref:toxin-antitoxin system YwqK family antitoxin n=1 Tax=Leptospira levettii TaxID=2023178 RepID=UPI003EC0B0AF
MEHRVRFPTNRYLLRSLRFAFVLGSLFLSLSCGKERVKQGDKDLSEDQNHFLLYKGKPFHGFYVAENAVLAETYETEFYKGVPHGSYTVKSFSGVLLESRHIRYGQKHGTQTLYFPSGQIRQFSEYEMGVPVGEHFEYFDNGQLATYQTFFPSGKPKVVKKWNKRGQIYLNQVFLETGESFGRPGSKLCDPIPEETVNQTGINTPNQTTKL